MAIAGFVCSFFVSIVGLVLSIIGLTQVNKSHERGRGLAIAGIVISAISIVGEILLAIGLVSLIGSAADYGYDYSDYGDYGSATSSIQSGVDVPADPLAGLPVRVA
ncbi:MAG: DUF4190 domain-containing protein [Bifidobacterium sp.]|nr:DUF4190 domain-containing protein [Bifidobacterium sp.]